MDASFGPKGWFAFDDEGRTLKTGFKSRAQAYAWIYNQLFPKTEARHGSSNAERRNS
jgi:hypothetical protein